MKKNLPAHLANLEAFKNHYESFADAKEQTGIKATSWSKLYDKVVAAFEPDENFEPVVGEGVQKVMDLAEKMEKADDAAVVVSEKLDEMADLIMAHAIRDTEEMNRRAGAEIVRPGTLILTEKERQQHRLKALSVSNAAQSKVVNGKVKVSRSRRCHSFAQQKETMERVWGGGKAARRGGSGFGK